MISHDTYIASQSTLCCVIVYPAAKVWGMTIAMSKTAGSFLDEIAINSTISASHIAFRIIN